jgi:hypothetical protein
VKKAFSCICVAQAVFLAVLTAAFSSNAQTTTTIHPVHQRHVTEDFALDTVLRLPEIREDDAYIRRVTKEKRHLFSLLYSEPDSVNHYYWVAVGEDNGMCFVTHFTFYVYTNGHIMYHDNVTDSTISLKTWQRRYHKK